MIYYVCIQSIYLICLLSFLSKKKNHDFIGTLWWDLERILNPSFHQSTILFFLSQEKGEASIESFPVFPLKKKDLLASRSKSSGYDQHTENKVILMQLLSSAYVLCCHTLLLLNKMV